MNAFLHNSLPFLDWIARRGKVGFFLLVVIYVVCSMILHLNGVDADKNLLNVAGPSMMVMAVMTVIGALAGSMVRVHLQSIDRRGAER